MWFNESCLLGVFFVCLDVPYSKCAFGTKYLVLDNNFKEYTWDIFTFNQMDELGETVFISSKPDLTEEFIHLLYKPWLQFLFLISSLSNKEYKTNAGKPCYPWND